MNKEQAPIELFNQYKAEKDTLEAWSFISELVKSNQRLGKSVIDIIVEDKKGKNE